MNFLHILRRFVFIFLAIPCWTFWGIELAASHYQDLGHPWIQTYLPGPYKYVNHFNSIVQGKDGFIYIGARNGILRYDGRDWKLIQGKGDLRLVKHQGRIFAYSRNRLYVLSRSYTGEPELIDGISALLGDPFIPSENLEGPGGTVTGSFLQVLAHQEQLYILTSDGLYTLYNNRLHKLEHGIVPVRLFPAPEGILILSGEEILYRYREDQLTKMSMPGGMAQLSQVLYAGDKSFYIDAADNRLIEAGPGDSLREHRQAGQFLDQYGFNCSVLLPHEWIAMGTRKGGIVLGSTDGRVLNRITTSSGLYSPEIRQLMADGTGNLWALHEHAVSRVEIPSAFSYYDTENGLYGNVKNILRHEGSIYAATSMGLFCLQVQDEPLAPSSPNAYFVKLPGVGDDCNCIKSMPGKLFVGGGDGLYELSPGKNRRILDIPVNVLHCDQTRNILIAGTEMGIRIYQTDDWSEIQNYSIPDISIDNIAVSPAGYLWLSSRSGVFYRSTKPFTNARNLSYTSYASEDLQPVEGSYIEMVRTPEKLLFSSFKGLFIFDPASGKFQPDSSFLFPFPRGSFRVGQMEPDYQNHLWIGLDHPDKNVDKIWYARPSDNGNFELRPLTFRRVNAAIINCLYAEPDGILWIGSDRGIVRTGAMPDLPDSQESHVMISAISSGDGPLLNYDVLASAAFHESLKKGLYSIRNSKNDLRFEFLSTYYNCESMPLFQYRLMGLDEGWSDWTSNPVVEYRGLPGGKYEFQVRNQDIFGGVSEPAAFPFRIQPPIYASWYAFLLYAILILISLYFLQKWSNLKRIREQYHLEEVVKERTESLIKEKEKAEDLLANILPKTTAEELKDTGKAKSSKFKMVTVLFSDIQGFTKIAEEMNPDVLIDQLDKFYFHFDSVVEKYNIEKIKTIGDAYMAAGGIPIKNRTNPVEVVLAALEMQQHMKELKKQKTNIWDLRIGIHTGSVIAGVVGQKKYSYDIWGDTVNTASRMESSGEVGRVNISATTYKLIKDFFQCEFRGKMPVKYKGDIAMFFVNGLNPTFTEADRVTPNARFFIQLQLLRLLDLEEFVLEKLEKELPEDLFFHNVEHTSHVYAQVELLGRGEKVSDEDLLMLRTAALLHDMGYIDRMDDHETRSVEYAREILPKYRYSEKQIERVCKLIMATVIPANPGDLLEQIICDANLDHIGRVDFLMQSDKLFQEYRMRHKIKSKKEWNQFQIRFLESHDFYTDIAKKMREVTRKQQIENILQFS